MNRPVALLWYRLISDERLEVSRQDVMSAAASEAMWLVRHGRGVPVLIEAFDLGARSVLEGDDLADVIGELQAKQDAMEARRRADWDRQGPLLFWFEVRRPVELDGEGGEWRRWSSHRSESDANTAGNVSGLPADRWRVVNAEDES